MPEKIITPKGFEDRLMENQSVVTNDYYFSVLAQGTNLDLLSEVLAPTFAPGPNGVKIAAFDINDTIVEPCEFRASGEVDPDAPFSEWSNWNLLFREIT